MEAKLIDKEKCTGCGLCVLTCPNNAIKLQYKCGFKYPFVDNEVCINCQDCVVMCPELKTFSFNKSLKEFVAYHKILERRMDGSSGGVYGALLETLVKSGYYFTGTIYTDSLEVKHILTNKPEEIRYLSGAKLTQSICYEIFPFIKDLLFQDEKVAFCGTPCQCAALKLYLGTDYDNLLLIDTICEGVLTQTLLNKLVNELEEQQKGKVTNIRFFNKEYRIPTAKRITFDNGITIFTKEKDKFDLLTESGLFYRTSCYSCQYLDASKRLGDISLGNYKPQRSEDDCLGHTCIFINTEKGLKTCDNLNRRIDVPEFAFNLSNVKSDQQISKGKMSPEKRRTNAQLLLETKSLAESVDMLSNEGRATILLNKLKPFVRVLIHVKRITQLKPRPLYQFIKYNFFIKGVKTNYNNDGFIYPAPYCVFSIDKTSKIILNGPLEIGVKRVLHSKLETRLWMKPNATLFVKEKCMFGYGSNVEIYKDALLECGNLFSNAELTIICYVHITLGNTVNIAKGCIVRDTNGHLVATKGFKMHKPVIIGNHTWICSDSTVMPGVTIGDGVIVGAMSYVSKNVKPFTMVQGNPAQEIQEVNYFRM